MQDNSYAFDSYLRNLADCEVMKPDEERAQAERIARLRAERWAVILSQPHFVPAIIALAEKTLDKLPDQDRREAARLASNNLVVERNKATLDAFKAATSALARDLAKLDRDQVVADMVCADLDAIEAGQKHGSALVLDLPRGRDQTFRRYVQRVRRATHAFWAARSAFAKANLRLVVSMARRLGRGRMAMSDLVQEGNIGLMQAIDRFDHTKGFRFSTYGAWWIRHAMNRALQNKAREIRLPVHVLDALHKLNRARREYESKHGHPAPAEVLAEQTGLSPAKIAKLDRHYLVSEYPARLDEPGGEDGERDRLETQISDDQPLPHEVLTSGLTERVILDAMADLPEMEHQILRMRFGLDDDKPLTLREIGEHYSLSRERIRQLQERALGRIRGELTRYELD